LNEARILIKKLHRDKILTKSQFTSLISEIGPEDKEYLFELAKNVCENTYGNRVFMRGLVEFSSYCKQNCDYCGIRAANSKAERYRLTKEQILDVCESGYDLGYRTFVLQSGEDDYYTDEKIVEIIEAIKAKFADVALTLSIGERSRDSYQKFFDAGADRYLLRHETASKRLYDELHPSMSFVNRRECLKNLKEIGFQVGAGFMVGLPGQTPEDLAEDLLFLKDLNPEMVGIGPFIPHKDTNLSRENAGELELTLVMIALVRLILPNALIPSTTALGSIAQNGRELGLLAGANVVMPNLSPEDVRAKYSLYDNKICISDGAQKCRGCIETRINSVEKVVDMSRGDYIKPEESAFTQVNIDFNQIDNLLITAKTATLNEIDAILNKAEKMGKLSHSEVAVLLQIEDEELLERMFRIAGEIKNKIYGNRVVVFAPLYISDYCTNNCTYCGYRRDNSFDRRKLNKAEIEEEVRILEKMGHKRLALEVGEDSVNSGIDFVLDSIKTIYNTKLDSGEIRRINVNVAATTVADYKKLKEAEIGTYILFQETYHKETFEKVHPESIKGDFMYHLTAFDRAMEAGIDDVGAGVLFGLYEPKFEVLGLLLHNEHLEKKFGVGFHTVSVPRLKEAEGVDLKTFPNIIDDKMFKKIVAVIRLMLPFTGIILSTRETVEIRNDLIKHGVSQISAGSSPGVGAYKNSLENTKAIGQFQVSDERTPNEILKGLIKDGFIPSYCTACYRQGRTGDRFMQLAKSGNIQNVCHPNALMTLLEYSIDYGDSELLEMSKDFIKKELHKISNERILKLTEENLEKIANGERDLFI